MTVYRDAIHQYIVDLFARPDAALLEGQEAAQQAGLPAISVNAEEGRFLQVLVRAIGASRAMEIGTLSGFSGSWIARGLVPGGRLITLEVDPAHAALARQNFERAGVSDRVEIRLGEALQLLKQLAREEASRQGPFDFIFIDADKARYPDYYEWSVNHIRTGGVIACHNALRGGRIVQPESMDETDRLMADFNRRAAGDPRVLSTIFPAGDGTLIATKIV